MVRWNCFGRSAEAKTSHHEPLERTEQKGRYIMYSTFIRTNDAITFGTKTFKNVLQFNLDKRQIALSESDREELRKVFTWNRVSKYYYKSFKTKKAMDNAYKALMLKYGEYFNAAADDEVISEAGKKTSKKSSETKAKKSSKKTSKKTETKVSVKAEPKKEETKVSSSKEIPVDEFLDIVEKEDKNEVLGYEFADVLKCQAASINKLIESFCDYRAQSDARFSRIEKALAKLSK